MDTVSYGGPAQCKDFASLHKGRSVFMFLGSTFHLHQIIMQHFVRNKSTI